jgi:hypothetical protein
VLPLDADEFWFSESHHHIRDALSELPLVPSVLETFAYDYILTERDDLSKSDLTVRLRYCHLFPNPKICFCRARGVISSISLGNHLVSTLPGKEVRRAKVPPCQLCRFHFRYTDQESFLRKVLNQVEGFIVSTAGTGFTSRPLMVGTIFGTTTCQSDSQALRGHLKALCVERRQFAEHRRGVVAVENSHRRVGSSGSGLRCTCDFST